MPYKSEAQKHLMEAAAHTPGGYGGVPQEVGKKFVEHADSVHPGDAAGVLHHDGKGKVLLVKRSSTCTSRPGYWAFPGGHIEEGETPFAAASREVWEETGVHTISAIPLGRFDSDGVGFHAYHQVVTEFEPVLNEEADTHAWFSVKRLPTPLIPCCLDIINKVYPEATNETEHDVMKDMRDGNLQSPARWGNIWLYDLRVTGTGIAVRPALNEVAFKNPSDYLSQEFLERCQGLPVILQHPEEKLLTTESFRERVIGTSCLPYIKGDEVWTIARVYDSNAAELMSKYQLSTSPAVTIGQNSLKQGDFLIEDKPSYIDHIAVCLEGVWDRNGPDGIRVDSKDEVIDMDKIDELMARIDAKFDEVHNKIDALAAKKEEEIKADSSNEEEDKTDSKEEEKEDKADSASCEEKKEEEMNKSDARVDSMQSKIEQLEATIKAMEAKQADTSINEREEIAKVQSRADSVALALGETASISPMAGERLMAFRTRLATRFSKFSKRFKDVNISSITDAALFAPIEDAIYADALEYAKAPQIAEGSIHLMESRDEAGRTVRTPSANSDPNAWMGPLSNGAVFMGSIRTQ